jgi:hypothetical protein
MPLFELEWFVCADGYEVQDRPRVAPAPKTEVHQGLLGPIRIKRRPTFLEDVFADAASGLFVVRKGKHLRPTRPLSVPAAYRQFADWDGTEAHMMKLISAYGFLYRPKATEQKVEEFIDFCRDMQRLTAAIKRREWQSIADNLKRAGQDRVFPTGGIGRLGLIFRATEDRDRPEMAFRPATLAEGLQVQALSDACLGADHRKCKNPECDRYFPIGGGAGAYRSDAEYHSEACRRRHAYIVSKKRGKRSS